MFITTIYFKEIMCERPRAIEHGNYELTNYRPRAVAIYHCNVGYIPVMDGFGSIICRDDGTWDRYPAECKLFAFNSYLPKDEVNKLFV